MIPPRPAASRRRRTVVALAAALALAPSLGDAQSYRAPLNDSILRTAVVKPIRACAVEAQRNCGGARDPLLCLFNQPVISGPCADALRQSAPIFPALEACIEDAAHLCIGVALGRGRVVTCLADQYLDLSRPCYNALATAADVYDP